MGKVTRTADTAVPRSKQIRKIYARAVIHYLFGVIAYFGFRFRCPVLRGHFRKFLTQPGSKPRPMGLCPACWSLERHRLLWLYLKDRTNFFRRKLTVLDIAPMPFLQLKYITSTNHDYLSVDISSPVAMSRMDITEMPLPEDRFDCILCYHVLEHIPEDRRALSEIFRVLKPGGWAIIQSPIDTARAKTYEDPAITSPQERLLHFGQNDHVRIYGTDYKNRLEQAGFNVTIDDYVTQLPKKMITRHGLTQDENIYICKKPRQESVGHQSKEQFNKNMEGYYADEKRPKG